MIVFFSSTSVILGAIIFVALILGAILGAGRAIEDILLEYSPKMILILSALAVIYWVIITYGTAHESGYSKKKYVTISSLLFGLSSGISLYNCIVLICIAIMKLAEGISEDGLLIVFTAIVWLFKAFFILLLCVPVAGLGIGIPFCVSEGNGKENSAYIWGSVALASQIIITVIIFLVCFKK